jgi:hypothetical protein
VLVQVLGQRSARHATEVHPDVERMRLRDGPHGAQRLLGERGDLGALLRRQVLVVRNVAQRQHHQVPGVVRVQVEDDVRELAPAQHQTVLVAAVGITQNGQPSPSTRSGRQQ